MVYSIKYKYIKSDENETIVTLSPMGSEIFEILLETRGKTIRVEEISEIYENKYGVPIDPGYVRIIICRINKVAKDLIKNRPWHGYYIDEDIKVV